MDENLKTAMEALVIDGDQDRAKEAVYRIAAEAARNDGPDRPFYHEVIRAYRADTAALADTTMPDDVARLLFVEHPEETFDASRYLVTDQARSIAQRVHAMRASAPKLRALGLPARNTTLLYGPPGTGKTEMARWIAFQEKMPLLYVNMSSTVDSLMGRTAKNIAQIFRYARNGSCMLMIDELDCIANARAAAVRAADGELNRTTITFMQEIDRLPPSVVLLAATNRVDMLDPALKRRFASVAKVERLPFASTRRLLDEWARSIEAETEPGIRFSSGELAKLMEGYESDVRITQAIVMQRAIDLLAEKIAERPDELHLAKPREEIRTFRIIDAQSGADVTDDRNAMRAYVEQEEWAKPLKYSSTPEGFLLDGAGRVRLYVGTAMAVAPRGRFEVVLSRFAE